MRAALFLFLLLLGNLATPGRAELADRAAFLRAIAATPRDFTIRLAFADWLDEHGDPDRALFIRAQIFVLEHSTYLGLGMSLSDGNETERMPLRAYLPRDALYHEGEPPLPYAMAESPAVARAEKISRQLFERHWQQWISEIDPALRERLVPRTSRHYFRERLAYLPGRNIRSDEKRWWYARFRGGVFGAVAASDFNLLDDAATEVLFHPERSTVLELRFDGNATARDALLKLFRAHPKALGRLHALSLETLVGSESLRIDRFALALLTEEKLRKELQAIDDLRLRTVEVDPGEATFPNAFPEGTFPDHLRVFLRDASPRRFALNRGNHYYHDRSRTYGAELLDAIVAPANKRFTERLTTLSFDHSTHRPPSSSLTEFFRRASRLRALRLVNPTLAMRTDTGVDLQGVMRLPHLATLSWTLEDQFVPPEINREDFPALRRFFSPPYRFSEPRSAMLNRYIRRNNDDCGETLAELAFLAPKA